MVDAAANLTTGNTVTPPLVPTPDQQAFNLQSTLGDHSFQDDLGRVEQDSGFKGSSVEDQAKAESAIQGAYSLISDAVGKTGILDDGQITPEEVQQLQSFMQTTAYHPESGAPDSSPEQTYSEALSSLRSMMQDSGVKFQDPSLTALYSQLFQLGSLPASGDVDATAPVSGGNPGSAAPEDSTQPHAETAPTQAQGGNNGAGGGGSSGSGAAQGSGGRAPVDGSENAGSTGDPLIDLLLMLIDAMKDNKISPEELKQIMASPAFQAMSPEQQQALFQNIDQIAPIVKNAADASGALDDGTLSADEAATLVRAIGDKAAGGSPGLAAPFVELQKAADAKTSSASDPSTQSS